jgi:glycerate dehydrogenase
MKIVILDAYSVNPGDIDWEPIRKLGELTIL